MSVVKQCPECGENLDFTISVRTPSYIVDGRLKANEVSPIAVLGCPGCSETVHIYEEHQIAEMLNEWMTHQ